MAIGTLPRLAVALVLATAAIVQVQVQHAMVGAASSAGDACEESNQACEEDSVCSACRETASSNTEGYESCILTYPYSDSVCVNQSMHPCCQAEASTTDCLANTAYVSYYSCRLESDVGGDCTTLTCDATPAPTPLGGVVLDSAGDADVSGMSGAGRSAPLWAKSSTAAAMSTMAGFFVAVPALVYFP